MLVLRTPFILVVHVQRLVPLRAVARPDLIDLLAETAALVFRRLEVTRRAVSWTNKKTLQQRFPLCETQCNSTLEPQQKPTHSGGSPNGALPTTRQGVPKALLPSGMSDNTKLFAPITHPSPTVTPLAITVLGPM